LVVVRHFSGDLCLHQHVPLPGKVVIHVSFSAIH
jgi:hypothetical protein